MIKQKNGFTLIELLVVVLIIMTIASLVIVALNTTRKSARDAKRITDLTMISSAIQLYYADKRAYPPTPTSWTDFMTGAANGLVTLRYLDARIDQFYPDSTYTCSGYYYAWDAAAAVYRLYFTPEDRSKASCTTAACTVPVGCPANGRYLIKNGQVSSTY